MDNVEPIDTNKILDKSTEDTVETTNEDKSKNTADATDENKITNESTVKTTKPIDKNESIEDIFAQDSLYSLFVGKKFGYYAKKWYDLSKKHENNIDQFRKFSFADISFNLPALIFNVIWCFYRKMYLNGIIWSILITLGFRFTEEGILWPLGFILPILFGLYSNKFYFIHVSKKIQKLKKAIDNKDVLKAEIMKKGDTSKLAIFGGTILTGIVVFIIGMIIGLVIRIIDIFPSKTNQNHAVVSTVQNTNPPAQIADTTSVNQVQNIAQTTTPINNEQIAPVVQATAVTMNQNVQPTAMQPSVPAQNVAQDVSQTNAVTNNAVVATNTMKPIIEDLKINLGANKIMTIKELVSSLAGPQGKVEWSGNDNETYINIKNATNTYYIKFSHNQETQKILLIETKHNERVCNGNSVLNCLV